MASDTDRKVVSEALRMQKRPLWRESYRTESFVQLVTDFDEQLSIGYGYSDKIKYATYRHFDRDTGELASIEQITRGKRRRVLHLINQANI